MSTQQIKATMKRTALGFLLGALGLVSGNLQAATITWGPATNVINDSDVSTNGVLQYAEHWGGTDGTVNGVAFTAAGTNVTKSDGASATATVTWSQGQGTLSSAYYRILLGDWYSALSGRTVTLNNLVSGHSYRIQIWAMDRRYSTTQYQNISGGPSLSIKMGQYAIGTFTADGATQVITCGSGSAGVLNAVQVREVTVGPVNAGTSSAVTSLGAVPADNTITATITVTLKDAIGLPVTNKVVTLVSSRGATDTISAASGPSSASGVVTFTVKSKTLGAAVFSATDVTDSNLAITQTANVTFKQAIAWGAAATETKPEPGKANIEKKQSPAKKGFIPDFKLKPDDYTVLMVADAQYSEGMKPFLPGSHVKFHVQGWKRPDQKAQWTISAENSDEYAVNVLVEQKSKQSLRLDVTVNGKTISAVLPSDLRSWQRISLPATVKVPVGEFPVLLRIAAAEESGDFDVRVHSLEFVRPQVRGELHKRAMAIRANTEWFQKARYGMMVHWTKQSMPLNGDQKTYEEAVNAFDVEKFADNMKLTGAGFVVVTTSHAFQYFPAPLASLDKILAGRTTKRDLVADLADALGKRGMKLFLYFHPGAHNDAEWLNASGFWKTDTTPFFNNLQSIFTEVGERYKDKLAGWWFDDGSSNYYYRSAPWEKLGTAAKAGYPQRLVAFNPWVLNSPTEFQDYFTGEGYSDPRGFGSLLKPDGNGHYPSGTHEGLQASACFPADRGNWFYDSNDKPLAGPRMNPEQLAKMIKEFMTYKNVPIFNIQISQDSQLSLESIECFRKAAEILQSK